MRWILTWPVTMCGTSHVSAGFTDGQKDFLKASLMVSPALRPENHCSLRPVGYDEAVNSMMNLAPIAAPLQTQMSIMLQNFYKLVAYLV
jgi:hypothetical protein